MTVIVSVLMFLLMFVALADIITIDASKMKHLPKIMWIVVVILLPLVGSILWFLVGRVYPSVSERGRPPVPKRTSSMPSSPRDSGIELRPRNTQAELMALEREIAAVERAERIRELEATLEEKKQQKDSKD